MSGLTPHEIRKLIQIAAATRQNAFAHRSLHKIGASVLTESGEVFGGCNVESVISGLGICAERCAIDHAIVHGCYRFLAVCTVDKEFTPTCGACLQYIMLFSQLTNKDIFLINADIKGNFELNTLSSMLPDGYKTNNNLEEIRAYGKKKKFKQK